MAKTTQRPISFSDDQWTHLGEVANELKCSRAHLIRHLIALAWHHTSNDRPFDPFLPGEGSPLKKATD